jgi:hypothetical protein
MYAEGPPKWSQCTTLHLPAKYDADCPTMIRVDTQAPSTAFYWTPKLCDFQYALLPAEYEPLIETETLCEGSL